MVGLEEDERRPHFLSQGDGSFCDVESPTGSCLLFVSLGHIVCTVRVCGVVECLLGAEDGLGFVDPCVCVCVCVCVCMCVC